MSDWTARYLAAGLPQRISGDPFGDCEAVTRLYGMENCAIATGQHVVQLSELYTYAVDFQTQPGHGCPREDLCPISLIYPQHGEDPAQYILQVINNIKTNPPPLALADVPNQSLLSIGYLAWTSQADMIAKCQAHIDAGGSLEIFVPPDHLECALGYFYGGLTGFDNRATSPGTFLLSWDEVYYGNMNGVDYVEAVSFNSTTIQGSRAVTTTSITSNPTISVQGNNPTGTVSIVATYSGDANNQPSVSAPLVLPVGSSTPTGATGQTGLTGATGPQGSPSVITPGVGTLTDAVGAVWSIGTNQNVYQSVNGVVNTSPGTGQNAMRMTLVNGVAAAQDPVYGAWHLFDAANNRWVTTPTPAGL